MNPVRKHSPHILLTFQYATSLGLIAFLIVVISRVKYIGDISPGFIPENRILIPLSRKLAMKYGSFYTELSALSGIINMSAKTSPFGSQYGADMKLSDSPGDDWIKAIGFSVQDNFFKTMGIELIEGKTFSDISGKDSSLFIIDSKTADFFGFDDALGKHIQDDFVWGRVIGVADQAILLPQRGEYRLAGWFIFDVCLSC